MSKISYSAILMNDRALNASYNDGEVKLAVIIGGLVVLVLASAGAFFFYRDRLSDAEDTICCAADNLGGDFTQEGLVLEDEGKNNLEVITLPDGRYRMFYHGKGGVSSEISEDGENFAPEAGMRMQGEMPATVKLPSGQWRMYFVQGGSIKSALSKDGFNFTEETGTRLLPGGAGSTDEDGLIHPSIVRLPDGTYKMYYDGVINGESENDFFTWSIMSASSPDGLNWIKDEGVRITSNGEEDGGLVDFFDVGGEEEDYSVDMAFSSHVEYVNDEFLLYYTVQAQPLSLSGIYLATSEDGINFEISQTPLIPRDSKWGDEESNIPGGPAGVPQDPFLLHTPEGDRLFYWKNDEGYFSAFRSSR